MAAAAAVKAAVKYLTHKIYLLQWFLLLGYGIMFMLCCLLIAYMRYNRHVALRGNAEAARKIILPAFEPLLWILCGTTGCYSVYFCTALATEIYTYEISKLATECFYSGRQFVFVTIAVFMLQKSVSLPALRRTIIIAFFLSTYTIPIVWYMVQYGDSNDTYEVLTVARSLLLVLYTYLLVRPPGRASKRTLREYCVFTYIYYALLFTYNGLFNSNKVEAGFELTYANLLWGSMCPLVIWRILRADTEHWRGMGHRAVSLQTMFRQKNNISEYISSQGLHVHIEMHRKLIIDFAYLDIKQKIGVGASAVVFNGILHSRTPVAIKVYTPSDFTEDTVAEFSHEAALCGVLHHPNIVKFYGMCVFPPTICLVSELCQGSLDDITLAITRRERPAERQQLLINLGYMLDAARAVAYIHSSTPAFLHRDIKPGNFLLANDNTVKLTDFGESRSIPRANIEQNGHVDVILSGPPSTKSAKLASGFASRYATILSRTAEPGTPTESSIPSSSGIYQQSQQQRMTVKGTVDYMAPEVIQGRAGTAEYGEAADVYSLAITMWDILYPGKEKYAVGNNHLRVFDLVLEGTRPVMDPQLHPSLRELLESAWQHEAKLRPSAAQLVRLLESIHEEIASTVAQQMLEDLEHEMTLAKNGVYIERTLTGERMAEYLRDQQIVSTPSEAVRMGNAFMDAGLLHHLKHSRPFEMDDATYYFDEETVTFCHPIAILEAAAVKAESDENATETTAMVQRPGRGNAHSQATKSKGSYTTRSDRTQSRSVYQVNGPDSCRCRQLGQRLDRPKTARHNFRRKGKANVPDLNMLTANLLVDEPVAEDFDDFETVVTIEH